MSIDNPYYINVAPSIKDINIKSNSSSSLYCAKAMQTIFLFDAVPKYLSFIFDDEFFLFKPPVLVFESGISDFSGSVNNLIERYLMNASQYGLSVSSKNIIDLPLIAMLNFAIVDQDIAERVFEEPVLPNYVASQAKDFSFAMNFLVNHAYLDRNEFRKLKF
ncbi:hypothetical protein K9L67_04720 [Candidatus Woesearchaeota archaeon]|nr:hypothetical protein [Candidatus Woesearchaeota archaeon]MCF7901503.1 hypothetical protein [Candidatus Woesearchaeota archaeon]MCF8013925.1 hypothetical protein [Candidatus Woesearchaeota archaeon]